jgi:hypothetical protein
MLFDASFGQSKSTKIQANSATKANSKILNGITSTELNLLNSKDFYTVLNDKLYRPKDFNYILQAGCVYDMLTNLGNDYYHLTGVYVGDLDQNYLLKNKNGNLTVISNAVRQMLNDSLIILDSGKIFNIFEEKFIESKGTDNFLRIQKSQNGNRLYLSTEGEGVNSQNFRSFEPIKSDIIKVGKWDYGGPFGDGSIFITGKDCNRDATFNFTTKHEEYGQWLVQSTESFAACKLRVYDIYDKRTQKSYHRVSFRTPSNKLFTELRAKWYPEGKKIVPQNLVLTKDLILRWYMDDGNWHEKGIYFNTQGFDPKSTEFLRSQLSQFLGLKVTIQKHSGDLYRLFIPVRGTGSGVSSTNNNIKRFLEVIGESPISCFSHKWGRI